MLVKGLEGIAHARLQIAEALLEQVHMGELELEEKSMVVGHPTAERLGERLAAYAQSVAGLQVCERAQVTYHPY